MAEVNLVKVASGILAPADNESDDWVNGICLGGMVTGAFKKPRNARFMRKFFALLRVGFDLWEPGEIDTNYGKPEKSFKQYRAQITVLAGYGEPVFNLDGSFRMIPRSISFASMEEEEFAKLYSNVINVILKNIPGTFTAQDLNDQVDRVMGFA